MAFLFFAVLFLIVYGSLYPFDFTVAALESARAGEHFYSWNMFSSRGDLLGNVALFFPYGFVGMLALPSRRPFAASFIPLALFGVMVAAGVQILQLFLPARDAALSDVLWNVLGLTLGAWMAALAPVREALRSRAGIRAEIIPLFLIVCWFASELAPFVPSIDLQSFKDSLKPLLLTPELDWQDFLRAFVAWLVVGHLAGRSLTRPPTWLWLLAGMVGLLAAKVVIVENVVTVANVAAAAAAFPAWFFLGRLIERRPQLLLALLMAYMIIAALEPFNLRAVAREFAWLPFSGSLTGSMLINAKVIAEKLFLIGSFLYLAARCGFRHRNAVILVMAFLAVLEVAQVWIGEHTPEITDPLLGLLLGAAFGTFNQYEAVAFARRAIAAQARQGQSPPSAPTSAATQLPQIDPAAVSGHGRRVGVARAGAPLVSRHGMVLLAAGCAAIVIALQVILGLPKIPYNVRELFGGENAWWKLVVFALAALSIGMGGTLAGHATARSRRPYLTLPGAAILACLATYLLLVVSTSTESIEDIAGSSNTYYFVMEKHMWGDAGAWLYRTIGSVALIGAVERIVRFVALVGPVFFWLTMTSASYFRATGEAGGGRPGDVRPFLASALAYLLSGLPWLILFKVIAFDYSSTDNLNELIENNGPVLYSLLILVPMVVVAIVHASRTGRARDIMAALLVTAVSLPLGWLLFKNGLAPEVHKYGHVFSGIDFLLGPDREELLPEIVLMLRWYGAQLAVIATLAYGMRIVTPPARRVAGMAMA